MEYDICLAVAMGESVKWIFLQLPTFRGKRVTGSRCLPGFGVPARAPWLQIAAAFKSMHTDFSETGSKTVRLTVFWGMDAYVDFLRQCAAGCGLEHYASSGSW